MTVERAQKLGRAFRLGFAFGKGQSFTSRLAHDDNDGNKDKVEFRTLENGQVIAIRDGKVVGGAGPCVGPDKLPTFEFFASADRREGQSFTKTVNHYVTRFLRPVVEGLRYPKGMPSDCERIVMSGKHVRELSSHMNADKTKVLPYVADVYRRGTFREAADAEHADIEKVVYTTATVKIGDEVFVVELTSKKKKPSIGGGYIQYGIGKADKAKGAADSVTCSRSRAAVSSFADDTIPRGEKSYYELSDIQVR